MPPKKKKLSKFEIAALIVMVAAALFMAVTAVVGKHGLLTYVQMHKRYESARVDLESMKKENDRLKKEIAALKEDPATIERVAREELGMVRPGEILYKVMKKDSIEEEDP